MSRLLIGGLLLILLGAVGYTYYNNMQQERMNEQIMEIQQMEESDDSEVVFDKPAEDIDVENQEEMDNEMDQLNAELDAISNTEITVDDLDL